MEKHRKLKKYQRKDYSQVVGFPVEIVGRDGVVRTYSFEDSILLYQRRITSAASRYSDQDLIDAEVGHCRRRIQQLRRSYFEKFGWAGVWTGETTGAATPDAGAEIASFLRRQFTHSTPSVENTTIQCVESDDHHQVYFVTCPTPSEGVGLLYVYRFEGENPGLARTAYREHIEILRHTASADDVEYLAATHQLADYGLVLTRFTPPPPPDPVGEVREAMENASPLEEMSEQPTRYDEAMAAFQDGNFDLALSRLESELEQRPDRREVVLAASVTAGILGRHDLSEFYAGLGCAQFPNDALMHHYRGLALLRQERVAEAHDALRRATTLDPALVSARFILALLEHSAGRRRQARRLLSEAARQCTGHLAGMRRTIRRVEHRLAWRQRGFVLAAVALGFGGILLFWHPLAAVIVLLGAAVLALSTAALTRMRNLVPVILEGTTRMDGGSTARRTMPQVEPDVDAD